MLAVLAPILAGGAFVAYVLVTTTLGIFRPIPWEYLALSAAGTGLGVWALWRRPRWYTGVSAALSVGLTGFFALYVFSLSMFGPREDHPQVGEVFPDFALASASGGTFHLAEKTDRRHLIVLYRGDW